METQKKIKIGMIHKGRYLIIKALGDVVEVFDFKLAKVYILTIKEVYDLIYDTEAISCKDVFISKLPMNEED